MVDSLSLKRSWQRDRVVVVPAFFLSFLVHGIDSGARWSLWRRVAGFDSSFFAIFYAKSFGFGPRLWVWMRSRCLIDWCSPNRGCVVADEAQNVQYSRWRCVSSVFMRIREEYVWCVIGVVVRRTISRIARWSSPLGDDSDLGKPLCVCVWSGDGWDLESGRLRLSIGVCPEIGGLVIVILSPVGFRRRILVGEDGEGCPNTCLSSSYG